MKKTTHSSNSNPDVLSEDELALQNVLNKHLDAQVENLDFNISSKLSAARHQALAGEPRVSKKSFGIAGLQWPALVAASCAVVLVAFLAVQLNMEAPEADSSQLAVVLAPEADSLQLAVVEAPEADSLQLATYEPTHFIEDLNILSAADDIDFFQSVEFLEWMESNAG